MRGGIASGAGCLVLALSVVPSVRPSVLNAQEPVRAHVMGDPLPGRDAPAFSLPYLTAEGPGPVDQPFKLKAELGRVVVLVFVPGLTDSAAVTLARTFSSQADSLFAGDVVIAAVASTGRGPLEAPVRTLAVRVKVLPDSTEGVRRLYGVTRGSMAAYVIDPLGRISWRNLGLNPYARSTYTTIRDAVRKARQG